MSRLIVAGRSARLVAESASRAGWTVTALDERGALDLAAFAEVVTLGRQPWTAERAAKVAAVVEADAVAYTADFENHPGAVARLAHGRRLLGNGVATLERVRDPEAVAAALARRGIAAPALATPSTAATDGGRAWVRKPRRSCGGDGVIDWAADGVIGGEEYLQERITGRPGSLLFAADGRDAVPLGVTRKLVGMSEFGGSGYRYCGSVLGSPTTPAFEEHERVVEATLAVAQALTEEFGLVGVNGLDFIACGDLVYPIELNPRFTAAMELLERAHGISVFDVHARACDGRLPRADLAFRPGSVAYGKAIVYARSDLTLPDTRPWLREPSIRDVPPPGAQLDRGDPICTVFAEAQSAATCRRALARRAGAVYRRLAHASAPPAEPLRRAVSG